MAVRRNSRTSETPSRRNSNASDVGEEAELQALEAWLYAQKIDYKNVSKTDQTAKVETLIPEFNIVLSRGIYAKQHVEGVPIAYQINLRLHSSGEKIIWHGGCESSFSSAREIYLSDVCLVSTGLGTSAFNKVSK
jgi:hypothetical protein